MSGGSNPSVDGDPRGGIDVIHTIRITPQTLFRDGSPDNYYFVVSPLSGRGFSVPSKARYALKVFDEALNLLLPLNRPGMIDMTRRRRIRTIKLAPPAPVDFVIALEQLTINKEVPYGMRLTHLSPPNDLRALTILRYDRCGPSLCH